jgi:hypothetical protein
MHCPIYAARAPVNIYPVIAVRVSIDPPCAKRIGSSYDPRGNYPWFKGSTFTNTAMTPYIVVCIKAPVLVSPKIVVLISQFMQNSAHGFPRRLLLGSS